MKLIDAGRLGQLHAQAVASPRRRSHVTWHDPAIDAVQRFFLHLPPGTSVRPHRHLLQRARVGERWEIRR